MTVNFSTFRVSGNDTLDLIAALRHCKSSGADRLVFDRDTYVFEDTFALELPMCVSNHGETGYRKSAFLIRDMSAFTVDGGGSTFVFKGIMNAFTVLDSSSVTLKGFTVEFPDYPYPNGFVTEIGENYFDLRFDSDKVCAENGFLYVKSGNFSDRVHCDVRFDGETHEIVHGTGDNSLGININSLSCAQLENGDFRFFDPPVMPKPTDVFGMLTGIRRASGILLDHSDTTLIEDITIHSCIGIGVMAQCCNNVIIDSLSVTSGEGRYVSSAADATHFVACTGIVSVKNSLFEHMLDDALNVHGIYTSIIRSNNGEAYVKFMNSDAIGIDIYKKGDLLAALDPDTLRPLTQMTVEEAVMINREITYLRFRDGSASLPVGCIVENLTRYPKLVFDGNTVRNNRARGMLIATNRQAHVVNCRFHTSGSAIVLECDGKFWYESGAVASLTIENNVFEGCRYANWDRGVISVPEGKRLEEDFYYHGRIAVIGNVFKGNYDADVHADNVSSLIYEDNDSDNPTLRLGHIGEVTLQNGATVFNL